MTDLSLAFEYNNRRFRSAEAGLAALARKYDFDLARADAGLRREMRNFMEAVSTALARRHSTPWPGGTSQPGAVPGTLSRRSGGLQRRLRTSATVSGSIGSELRGIFRGSEIMAVHEFGATIRARHARYLTVPLPAALNPDGTPRRQRARDWDNTFVAKSRAGNLIIFQRRSGEETPTPLYVLKKEVYIPPRLGVRATFDAGIDFFVDNAVKAMRDAIIGDRTLR